jgi:AcrR family transcriptional regulator
MANAKTVARRKRRRAAREAQILDAAAAVFAEKGFSRATTKEIADVANVSEGTIYNYFGSKRDLLLGIADHLIGSAMNQTMSELANLDAATSDASAYIDAIMRNSARFVRENQSFLQALATEIWTDPELQEQFFNRILEPIFAYGDRYLQALVAVGKTRPCQVEIVVPTIGGSLIFISMLRALAADHFLANFSDDELVDELTRLYICGLRPDSKETAECEK